MIVINTARLILAVENISELHYNKSIILANATNDNYIMVVLNTSLIVWQHSIYPINNWYPYSNGRMYVGADGIVFMEINSSKTLQLINTLYFTIGPKLVSVNIVPSLKYARVKY